MQSTNHILMIRPASFCKNEETAVNNVFQQEQKISSSEINTKAQKEFDDFAQVLIKHRVTVNIIEDTHISTYTRCVIPKQLGVFS